MDGTVASNKKLVGTLSGNGTMTGGMGTVFARDGISPTVQVVEVEGPPRSHRITINYGEDEEINFYVYDGIDGENGEDAYVTAVDNGFDGTEAEWIASLHGKDGFSPIVEVSKTEPGWAVAITDSEGTHYFDVSDGVDGASAYEIALNNGFDGTEEEWVASLHGEHGISPLVHISELDGGHEVTITDAVDNKVFFVKDGIDGKDGVDGTVAFDDLTEEQRESLRGEPGDDYVLTDADKREIASMIEGSEATVPQEVIDHISIEGNPHKTKCEDIGAVTKEQHEKDILATEDYAIYVADQARASAEEEIALQIENVYFDMYTKTEVDAKLADHTNATGNPHGATYTDVGAAPAGYGLGERKAYGDNWNSSHFGAFLRGSNNSPDGTMWYGLNCINGNSDASSSQIAFSQGAGAITTEARRTKSSAGDWGVWEYVNPPMAEGVEYRTTERRNGKAVYKKLENNTVFYRIDGEDVWNVEVDEAYVYGIVEEMLAQANIAYVGSATPTNDMGKDGDIYIVSG